MHTRSATEAEVRHALASEAKCKILASCIGQPLSARAISNLTDLPLASTYRQLKSLVEDHVVAIARSAMTRDGKPYDLYQARICAARLDISPGRVRATWQSNPWGDSQP